RLDRDMLAREFSRVDQSIAMAALFTANHMKVKAVVALTQTGATAQWISRVNCGVPIYALTPEIATYRRLSLYRDVFPMMLAHDCDQKSLLVAAEMRLLEQGLVQPDDLLVLTVGDTVGQMGSTNTMKIIRVAVRE
ncbi:MAG: pyruvate kinase, partial [Burkholderiales bacterium]|nr:pyruvate kinase [Burkholderiales bacterium]